MFLYDIRSFPEGMNFDIWLELHNKGIVFYDSMSGVTPIRIDDNTISFIEMNSMDVKELNLVREKIKELMSDDIKNLTTSAETFRINNQKLIDYLKNINNEKI